VPIVLKSGSLNLLEPSGPVQACNGIALPLLLLLLLLLYYYTEFNIQNGFSDKAIKVVTQMSVFSSPESCLLNTHQLLTLGGRNVLPLAQHLSVTMLITGQSTNYIHSYHNIMPIA